LFEPGNAAVHLSVIDIASFHVLRVPDQVSDIYHYKTPVSFEKETPPRALPQLPIPGERSDPIIDDLHVSLSRNVTV
jgi:hypothetical protein